MTKNQQLQALINRYKQETGEKVVDMEMVADCGCMNSLEILEVNPILDTQNKTAYLATELIISALGKTTLYD